MSGIRAVSCRMNTVSDSKRSDRALRLQGNDVVPFRDNAAAVDDHFINHPA
jgi:hypothetical protein